VIEAFATTALVESSIVPAMAPCVEDWACNKPAERTPAQSTASLLLRIMQITWISLGVEHWQTHSHLWSPTSQKVSPASHQSGESRRVSRVRCAACLTLNWAIVPADYETGMFLEAHSSNILLTLTSQCGQAVKPNLAHKKQRRPEGRRCFIARCTTECFRTRSAQRTGSAARGRLCSLRRSGFRTSTGRWPLFPRSSRHLC